jgi:uncharacterized protein (TIGR00156 family)
LLKKDGVKMKNYIKYISVISLFTVASNAEAGFVNPSPSNAGQNPNVAQSFNHHTYQPATVAQAKALHDDQKVILTGFIIQQLPGSKGDKFIFQDENKGQITVDIDYGQMPSRKFDSKTKLHLYGEVDVKHSRENMIDVDRVEFVDCLAKPAPAAAQKK